MRFLSLPAALVATTTTLLTLSSAQLDLDTSSQQSIKSTAKQIAKSMVKIYTDQLAIPGWGIPGLLPPPYYWWQSGGMFGVLIGYWHVTGDDSYNDLVSDALLYQVGPEENYMPPNQSKSLGNDDQAFWGFAAMTAAEYNFPNPPPDQPQWLALAQAVWNSQQLRWNTQTCGGGLNWQLSSYQSGYHYKHTPTNAGFINLGARLYAYTGNETYAEWTVKTWDWIEEMGLIGGHLQWTIFDGVTEDDNCTSVAHTQWTYNFGMMINGAAAMYHMTEDDVWKKRVQGIWDATQVFWQDDKILREVTCEEVEQCGNCLTCNNDQRSFKSYFLRWVAVSTKWAPFLKEIAEPYFLATAQAVGQSCNPSEDGAICGQRWDTGSFFNATGPGEQMCALEAMNAMLIGEARAPFTAKSGGTSVGDPSAGTQGDDRTDGVPPPPSEITTADRAGAGILTALVLVGTLGLAYCLVT